MSKMVKVHPYIKEYAAIVNCTIMYRVTVTHNNKSIIEDKLQIFKVATFFPKRAEAL
jgi:hypothetical protein